MVRAKSKPSRLPNDTQATALSSYEVRLSGYSGSIPLAQELDFSGPDFLANSDQQYTQRKQRKKSKKAIKDAEMREYHKVHFEFTPSTCETDHIRLCLARGKIAIDNEMIESGKVPAPGTPCKLLYNSQSNDLMVQVVDQEENPPCVLRSGDASHWLGAEKHQLLALGTLTRKRVVLMPVVVGKDSEFVTYEIGIPSGYFSQPFHHFEGYQVDPTSWYDSIPLPTLSSHKVGQCLLQVMHWLYPMSLREAVLLAQRTNKVLLKDSTRADQEVAQCVDLSEGQECVDSNDTSDVIDISESAQAVENTVQEVKTSETSTKECRVNISKVFHQVRPSPTAPAYNGILPELIPTLRPYQKRAIQWMINRETQTGHYSVRQSKEHGSTSLGGSDVWETLLSCDGEEFHFCAFNGAITMSKPFQSTIGFSEVRGGILADEMGLGKTVEALGLILARKCPFLQPSQQLKLKPYQPMNIQGSGESTTSLMNSDDIHENTTSSSSNVETNENTTTASNLQRTRHSQMFDPAVHTVECPCTVSDAQLPGGFVQCSKCSMLQHVVCAGLWNTMDASVDACCIRELVPPDPAHETQYLCITCVAKEPKETTGATLVVCPAPILMQWEEEIERHSVPGSVRLCIYQGVREISSKLSKFVSKFSKPSRQVDNDSFLEMSQRAKVLHPQLLKDNYDVVLTTYDTLRKDLHHLAGKQNPRATSQSRVGGLRQKKKYHVVISPLTCLKWWRLCVDEAQMVESSTSQATETARELESHHSWCITGTPVGHRGLDDLWGLLVFLRVEPYSRASWWRTLISRTTTDGQNVITQISEARLQHILECLMWRNCKVDVKHELQLPPITHHVHELCFSQVERHFYEQQKAIVNSLLSELRLGRVGNDDSHEADAVMGPLLRLRQACCHPQVGTFGIRRVQKSTRHNHTQNAGSSSKTPMTMQEVLDQLVHKALMSCEEAQRKVLMSRNGLAALQAASGKPEIAEQTYLESMRVASENEHLFKSDSLQRLHTVYHLRMLLQSRLSQLKANELNAKLQQSHENGIDVLNTDNVTSDSVVKPNNSVDSIDPTQSCETASTQLQQSQTQSVVGLETQINRLGKQLRQIEKKHMYKWEQDVTVARHLLESRTTEVEQAKQRERECMSGAPWWIQGLEFLVNESFQHGNRAKVLINRLRTNLSISSAGGLGGFMSGVESIDGLRLVIVDALEKLDSARKQSLKALKEISLQPTQQQIAESADCQVCRSYFNKKGPVCRNCKRDRILKLYEQSLFSYRETRGNKKRQSSHLLDLGQDSEANDDEGFAFRKPAQVHSALQIIFSTLKTAKVDTSISRAASYFFEHVEAMKKELAAGMKLWRQADFHLKALDELEMHKIKIRLLLPGEQVEEGEELWKLHPIELPTKFLEVQSDLSTHQSELNSAMSQYRYLTNLRREQVNASQTGSSATSSAPSSSTGDKGERVCVICQESMGKDRAFLPCGHMFCANCTTMMKKQRQRVGATALRCPTCRVLCELKNIQYSTMAPVEPLHGTGASDSSVNAVQQDPGKVVEPNLNQSTELSKSSQSSESLTNSTTQHSKNPNTDHSNNSVSVHNPNTDASLQQRYGTKLGTVIHMISGLEYSDPTAKSLVFSQWEQVLDILELGLQRIGISHIRLESLSNKFYSRLHAFKNDPTVRVLLLPTKSGANGLNLTEATNVFMVEPLLNPALEQQAVNRVHRLGQTMSTNVHHFIVKDTIEERVIAERRTNNETSSSSNGFHAESELIKVSSKEASSMSFSALQRLLQ